MKTLLAVDGSDGSRSAASLLSQLIDWEHDEVVLYYSLPATRFPEGEDKELRMRAEQGLANQVFQHAKGELPAAAGERITQITSHEHPRSGILAAAESHAVDMIALGARGLNPIQEIFLGSVSRSVVHQSKVPVLVGRQRATEPAKSLKVVFACDQKGISREAQDLVTELSWPADVEGWLIHIIESLFGGQVPDWLRERAEASEEEPLSRLWVEQDRQERAKAARELEERRAQLPTPFHEAELTLLEGHPGEQLVNFVVENRVDLTIVGARRLGAIARFFTGSTSDYLLNHAACSVLLVPHVDAEAVR